MLLLLIELKRMKFKITVPFKQSIVFKFLVFAVYLGFALYLYMQGGHLYSCIAPAMFLYKLNMKSVIEKTCIKFLLFFI